MRIVFLYTVFIILRTWSSYRSLAEERSESQQPNIVMIVADDIGWNDVGWNNPNIKTPVLNKMAKEGVILDSLYMLHLCSPSRAAVMTGYYPFKMGLQYNVITDEFPKFVPARFELLPEKLKELNYATHIVGKWHLGICNIRYCPTERGFDTALGPYTGSIDYYNRTIVEVLETILDGAYDFYLDEEIYRPPVDYVTNIFTRRAEEIIATHDKSHPLFLYLPFTAPHTPLQVPDKYLAEYECIHDTDRRIYSAMMTSLDEAVDNITKALRQYSLSENTLIIFVSDNGGAINLGAGNNHPLRGGKSSLWEGGTRVPGFVYSETLLSKTGYRNTRMIHAVDFFPTIVYLAGGDPDNTMDGVNQWPALSQDASSARTDFVYNINEIDQNAAIRVGDLKLIEGNASPGLWDEIYELPPDSCQKVESSKVGHSQKKISDNVVPCPLTKFKLFNITDDPQETFDLSCYLVSDFEKMKSRLQMLKMDLVSAQELTHKEASGYPVTDGVLTTGWC